MITSINLFNKLREEILTGKLRRGYRLIEAELCKKYKISRTPVRDSLIRLEMCGLVENLPNRGAWHPPGSHRQLVRQFDRTDPC